MVYIYKKRIGNTSYYYLRASERRGHRIVSKDIAYLGNSIDEVKKSIGNLPKFKEKIRKAYKTIHKFIESNHYLEKAERLNLKRDSFLGEKLNGIEACRIHYNNVFQKYDSVTKSEIFKNFIIDFAFNTTSIEGNTISLLEARNLLEEGFTPKNKSLREIYDVQNTEKTFLWILKSDEELSHEFIIKIHSMLMENIDARKGYRTTDVRVIKSNFEATPAPYVKTDMNLLLDWYEKNKNILHPFVLAVVFHHKFEKIHPFMDGNGRTGRMILNFILMKNEYPPMIIHKKTREDYLVSLRNADKNGLFEIKKDNYLDLVRFCTDEMLDSYWNLFL
jgi:Fic family protein